MKSVLLIGNGGSLKGSGLGNKIDEFDEVIRINEGKTKGWEEDAGTKFTIWATFNPQKKFIKYYGNYRNMGYNDEQIADMLSGVKEIWYISPVSKYLHMWPQMNRLYRKMKIDDAIIRLESEDSRQIISHIVNHPTTGFILMNILLSMYDHIYIAGFDFLGSRKQINTHHYFTDTKPKAILGDSPHEFDKEAKWVEEVIEMGNIIDLEKDTQIVKSKFIGNMNGDKYEWER